MIKFVWMIILVVTGPAYAATSKSMWRGKGILKFEKTHLSLGDVQRGQILSAIYRFKNTGTAAVMIQGVHSGCGCITADDLVGQSFDIGETGSLEVKFDSSDFDGKIKKNIVIATNAPGIKMTTLTLRARVHSEVTMKPPVLAFGKIKESSTKELIAVLNPAKGKTLKIHGMSYDESALSVRIIEEGIKTKIGVSLLPQRPKGLLKESINISTNLTHQKDIKLLVRATITGNLELRPGYVEFGSVKGDKEVVREVTIKSPHSWDLFGQDVEISVNGQVLSDPHEFLEVDTIGDPKALKRRLKLSLKRNGYTTGNVRGRVTLRTSEPLQQNVDVNFYAYFH